MTPVSIILLAAAGLTLAAVTIWRRPLFAFGQRGAAFGRDVRGEVRKISWPSWDDLRRSTMVITILVIVIGIIIGLMDALFSKVLIEWLGQALA